jgi:hypothetical protein
LTAMAASTEPVWSPYDSYGRLTIDNAGPDGQYFGIDSEVGMRKIMALGGLIGGVLLSLALALPAVAQAQYPPNPPEEPNVVRQGEGADVAFTGQDVTLLLLVIGALVVAGVVALVVARRRAASATG